jgi:hypothetical protein
MDPLGPDPLIRSFERHLDAENRSSRTVTGYLVAVRQADSFLRERGTSLEAATRGDLERSWATCSPAARPAPPPPTTRSSRSSTAGCAERWIRTLKDRNLSFLHSTATAA